MKFTFMKFPCNEIVNCMIVGVKSELETEMEEWVNGRNLVIAVLSLFYVDVLVYDVIFSSVRLFESLVNRGWVTQSQPLYE